MNDPRSLNTADTTTTTTAIYSHFNCHRHYFYLILQVLIARECKECSRLKVLCMQGYTPPPRDDILELLLICSQIRTLQKAILFPEAYAFPGNIEQEREMNKYQTMALSYRFMEMKGRFDIQLE